MTSHRLMPSYFWPCWRLVTVWVPTPGARRTRRQPPSAVLRPAHSGPSVGHAGWRDGWRSRRRRRPSRVLGAGQGRVPADGGSCDRAERDRNRWRRPAGRGWLCHRVPMRHASGGVECELRRWPDRAELVVVPVSPSGTVCFFVYGAAHLLADVSGYFPTAGDLASLTPAACSTPAVAPRSATRPVRVHPSSCRFGKGGLPVTGVGAVALNVTVADGENPTVGQRLRLRLPVWSFDPTRRTSTSSPARPFPTP